jgi:predicted AAA+ superfamily ATPase
MYIHRTIEKRLKIATEQFPVCLVTGPRQAGKSTLLQYCFKNFLYVSLDDPLLRELANRDPELFLSAHASPLIIDEIQYAPSLLPYIKLRVDANRHVYGQYILTGSQSFQLMKGVSETLAGRIAVFQLFPLSWDEISHIPHHHRSAMDDIQCANQIVSGFYPEFFAVPQMDKNLWLSSYLSTYIERDLRNMKAITDLTRFQTFINLLAARAGQLLNMNELSKEVGVSQPTIKDWITLLEATYIIYILKPFHNNRSKRLIKTPKIYFVDTGILCYLLGIDSSERLFKAAERGHIFENMVIMEFVKRLSYHPERSACYFYRVPSGDEVDFIVERQRHLEAYEIKFAKTVSSESAKTLKKFMQDYSVNRAHLLSLQEKVLPLFESVTALHWSMLN